MHTGHHYLPREVRDGIITLLVHAAVPESRDRPYAVITTAPSEWLSRSTADRITILDVTGIVGATPWTSEADVTDTVVESLHDLGWPKDRILRDLTITLGPDVGPLLGPELANRVFQADLTLANKDREVFAQVFVKRSLTEPELTMARADVYLRGLSCLTFITDGVRVFRLDAGRGVPREDSLPSPRNYGFGAIRKRVKQKAKSDGSVVRCHTVDGLVSALNDLGSVSLVVDHTIPWGVRTPTVLASFGPYVPEKLAVDVQAGLIALIAAQGGSRRVSSIVPRAVTASSQFAEMRVYLEEKLGLAAIVELPAGVFSPSTSIPTTVISLGSGTESKPSKTAFISLPILGDIVQVERKDWFLDLRAGLQGLPMTSGFDVDLKGDLPWTYNAYNPAQRDAEERLGKIGDVAPLGELCDVFLGFRYPREEPCRSGGTPIIRGRDISANALARDDLSCYNIKEAAAEKYAVVEGDVILQRIGANPRCLVADSELVGAVATDTVFVLRPSHEKANGAQIAQFLRSMVGRDLLASRAQGASAPTLSVSSLRSLPILILPDDITQDLGKLEEAERDLRTRADAVSSTRLSVFGVESIEQLKRMLTEARQVAHAVSVGAKQAETLGFRIGSLYPFPLAYPYRALASLTLPQELYREQLRVSENILAFLGSVTLALMAPEDIKSCGIDLLNYWRGGISPGHWREICQRGADVLKEQGKSGLSQGLAGVWDRQKRGGLFESVEALIVSKNDYKHDRGPKTDDDFQTATVMVGKLLTEVMAGLEFFTDFPMHLVCDMDTIRGTDRVVTRILNYVGDHPALPQDQLQYHRPLKKNDIYLEIEPDSWVPLFPFVSAQNCPECRTREVYFVDRLKDRIATLKSFERGHSVQNAETASELAAWQGA